MAKSLPLLALLARGAAVDCPTGPDEAPRTALTVAFPRHHCEIVRNEFKARMSMDYSYAVTHETSDALGISRTSDTTHDVFTFSYEATLQAQRQGSPRREQGCLMSACGVKLRGPAATSRGDDDGGELYCSMRDLYCGAREDCGVLLDFGAYVEAIAERSRSRTDATLCLGGARPSDGDSINRHNDQRGFAGNYGRIMSDGRVYQGDIRREKRNSQWKNDFYAPNTATIPNGADPIRNPYPYPGAHG